MAITRRTRMARFRAMLMNRFTSLRPHRPRFYLSSFSLPGLTPAGQFAFNVSDRNSNRNIGIYYESMDGSVYYNDQRVSGGPVKVPFYQPPKNTTLFEGTLSPVLGSGDPIWDRIGADGKDGKVAFRLELNSTIRFKVEVWDTHDHEMHVSCDVEVGSDGNMLPEYKEKKCTIYFG
ncbi:hypothetical protein J5N97_027239 [Dioscorea zingiberensis]|uniref:Late embryogenesis abundant protein LEA-2 subgroup domain-containing protein n=1 Tax=Dioscorea zingiberensis TaxID=325984 RepID=A0A9D5C3M7_9LILI|nr:hypothetical protein J5N97_027239 [Dioscorea zingiberensis]